jgi:hypothetical protein
MILRDGSEAIVDYTIASAEPDVGIMGDYAEEWWLVWLHGAPVASGNTCYRREIEERMLALEIEPYSPEYEDYCDG